MLILKGFFSFFLFFTSTLSALSGSADYKRSEVTDLRCEYFENPLGIDQPYPKLSWIIRSVERNQKQTAYQILVSSNKELLDRNIGDIWDTRKVDSDQSVQIIYQGKELQSVKKYFWKVRIWDHKNKRTKWSKPASWETGILDTALWKAGWIGFESERAPLLRKKIEINQPVKEARIYISGLGYYELSLNGNKVGDHVLDPGQTDYEQRTFYVVYDVSKQLRKGANAIGVMLGNGWYHQNTVNTARYGWGNVIYGKPRLLFQMLLKFIDGTEKWIVSDETWKAFPGPVTANNLYAGEDYDARLETAHWDSPDFNDNNWKNVRLMDAPGGALVYQNIPPIKKMDTIAPVKITQPKAGVYLYDMGQNFAGWAKLRLNADSGSKIQLRFAESLHENGLPDFGSTGVYATEVIQTDSYICKGGGLEIWEPRFTYHGFRYVEVTGFPGIPDKIDLEGIVVYSSLEKTGKFHCSDERFNRLHQTALWTQISNMHSIPTDCPHRERCGWLGDAFLTSDMTMYNFNAASFWSKFLCDIETTRRGGIPDNISPGKRSGDKDPDWGAAFVQLTWNMYLYYGDRSIIRDHYEGLGFFMNHLQKLEKDHIIYSGIGSLFPPNRIRAKETSREFTTTMLYQFCSDIMSRMAQAIGKNQDAEKYANLSRSIKDSFNKKFYNTSLKTYGGQEKNALALAFSLVPSGDEQAVAANLQREIADQHDYHTYTGIFGSRYIYWVLAQYGYGETVKKVFHSNSFPGYGYLFSRGATTFWENWGETEFEDRKGTRGDDRSKNHPFQGGFDAGFYDCIAGIRPDPEKPGFRHIIFHPQLTEVLEYAEADYRSIYGLISSKWKNKEEKFEWSITVPSNTRATVYLPATDPESVYESGKRSIKNTQIKFLRKEGNHLLYEVGSGTYNFAVKR